MKILITGGCGFIGSHIVEALQKKKHTLLVVDNLSNGRRKIVSCPLKVADIRNKERIKAVFLKFKPEVVVHTAAQAMLRKSLEQPIFDAQINILGTISVLEACAWSGVKKIIYTATGGACYGEPKRLPVKEVDTKNPIAPYGISKYASEHYVQYYSRQYGMDHLIFRFGNVYGPGDNPASQRLIPTIINSLLKNQKFVIFGDGKQTRDFLYVKDIANLIATYVSKKSPDHIYNLGSGQSLSVDAVYNHIAKELKIKKSAEYAPAIQGEVKYIFLDCSKAKKESGWNPTPFEKGIKETIAAHL